MYGENHSQEVAPILGQPLNEEATTFDTQSNASIMSPEAQKKRDKRAAYIAAKAVGIGNSATKKR